MEIFEEIERYAENVKVLYVEDDYALRTSTYELLDMVFDNIEFAENGEVGLEKFKNGDFHLVITDINMPIMNGIEMIKGIKTINDSSSIVVTSAHDDSSYLLDLIHLGVDNFILKPFTGDTLFLGLKKILKYRWMLDLENRYKTQLENEVAIKTEKLLNALKIIHDLSDEIVLRLSAAAEYRDVDTGEHIKRLGFYAEFFAKELGMDEEFIEEIKFAAPLHDIGKIGIPDNILLKKGKLTQNEFEIIKNHTVLGDGILNSSEFKKIQMAQKIALTHHERWDGTGYPFGLKENDIPIEGRIVAICDVYDALRSARPYKEEMTHEKAVEIILTGDGRVKPDHFDPNLLNCFKKIHLNFNEIFEKMIDSK